MTLTFTSVENLAEFLKRPETKPACEYIDGNIVPKPMPKGKHSRLQLKLCDRINEITESNKIAGAFPELRCSFGTRSLVPDIAVFQWSRIPFDANGEVPDDFLLYPDWIIEILSPQQSPNRVTGNILYCLQQGSQLGWLIDPSDRSVLIFKPAQQPDLLQDDACLPVLSNIPLSLTVNEMFSALKMNR